jgi:peptide/nickel transport system substrate-binding protein
MRFTSPWIVATAVSVFALTACGGSGDSSPAPSGADTNNLGNAVGGTDATAKGPVTIPGAEKGGTVTVLTATGLTTTLDPSEVYYLDTISIETNLLTRSLTQYRYDPATKQMVLVPDLATDLGSHNDDFTKWTFTIRDGVKWENGDPVTAKEVAWGIQRCMDLKTFPTGPCQYYANVFFKGGSSYQGPYTAPNQRFHSVKVSGNTLTIKMNTPFADMPYFGAFPAMGPIPLGSKASDPRTYKNHPLSTGPYEIASFSPSKELVLKRNPNWSAATDPARTQYPDGYDFKTQQQSEKIDQILLADTGPGQTTLTYDNLLSPDYTKLSGDAPERITSGGTPCTYYWGPDNRKITSKVVREALSWAYPYKNIILAGGDIPGVTAIPANNLMPPGIAGRTPYNITGRKDFQTDAAKAKKLLASVNSVGYEIRFLFRTDDSQSVQIKDATVKALTDAGFKATPVPTTVANYTADRDNPDKDINLRSVTWCSDWPSGATWLPPTYGSTHPEKTGSLGANYTAFNHKAVDNQIAAVQQMPLAQQPAAWSQLDESIMRKYFPLFPTYYSGTAMAHGSEIMGDANDSTLGMPTWRNIWVKQ